MEYQAKAIETRWRNYWREHKTYEVANQSDKPKFYILDMFPYPSGSGLHVGHPLGYVASDIFARYKRMKGYHVLHPMGYDAFGLPAEQYAIQTGIHPAVSTKENIERYRAQLDLLGLSFDWSREVNTSEPNYYRWTQEIFSLLFEHYYDLQADKALPIKDLIKAFEQGGQQAVEAVHSPVADFSAADWAGFSALERQEILMNYRLAYRKVGHVNWCEALGSVLANDEVINGLSERGGHPVVKREMVQWSLRITAYAERLLGGLDEVDFSESIKTQQKNWIGKSEGARLFFETELGPKIEVFTTRPDTIYGVSFLVLAPEHELVKSLLSAGQKAEVEAYLSYVASRSERERLTEVKRVTGAFLGAYALHPLTGAKVPIWISEYVLAGYGTGAIMAVPAEDERDQRFAQHFDLPILPIIDKSGHETASIGDKLGRMMNSESLNGLSVKEAMSKALSLIEEKGIGKAKVSYKLHDANFSRQRYWGEPFPISYDEQGLVYLEKDLPVTLPPLDNFKPTADGRSPLARAEAWAKTPEGRQRELDTMPGFAGSSWYYLRYMDANNEEEAFSAQAVNYWQAVDVYVGGSEHAVGHLLYSRFWHKFLYDLGKVPTQEPYKKLINQGMIQGIIEYIFMLKERREGKIVFVCDGVGMALAPEEVVKVHVRSDMVKPTGGIVDSYLDAEGIEAFKAWRPEYAEAIFETNEAGQLTTYSEVGKMSKRYHNVVNPDDVVEQYGADAFRMYEMFLGPLEQSKPWDTRNIEGTFRFLKRFWSLFYDENGQILLSEASPSAEELRVLHITLQKVNQDLEAFSFNTCVAHFMKAVNDLKKLNCHKRLILQPLCLLLAPFAPHMAEELWQGALGQAGSVHLQTNYPQHEDKYLEVDEIEYPVQINGKVRFKHRFATEAGAALIQQEILALPELAKWLEGKEVKRVVVVPKRMINVVLA